ncbi:MAG: Lrp/AsnC family transcriptional regulator [Candidatus Helarchaeota archaeon]
MEDLDETNQKILKRLMKDGRTPYREIADELGLSESTVRKRVSKMIENQIIDRFTIALNPERGGKKVLAFLTVVPSAQSNIKDLWDSIVNFPEISEAFYMSGKCGLLLKCEVQNLQKLDELLEQIRELRGINELESCIVIRVLKRGY